MALEETSINFESYQIAIDEIKNVYSYPWVNSIYQYGAINNPGISDLDIIIVENCDVDSTEFWNDNSEAKNKLSKITRQIMGHASLIFAPNKYFENVNIQDQLTLDLKKGKRFNFDQYPDFKDSKLTMIRLIDWLPERYLLNKKLLGINSSEIEARFLLGFLKSVCHSIKQLSIYMSFEDIKLKSFSEKINNLRLNLEKSKHLLSNVEKKILLQESKGIIEFMIFSLNEYLNFANTEIDSFIFPEKLEFQIPSRGKIIYKDSVSFENDSFLSLPYGFSIQWLYYFQNGFNFLNSEINNQFSECNVDLSFLENSLKEILFKRLKIAKLWLQYKSSRNFLPSILKNGFF